MNASSSSNSTAAPSRSLGERVSTSAQIEEIAALLKRVKSEQWWQNAIDHLGREPMPLQSKKKTPEGRKGILLLGGSGSRLHPISEKLNKHLLPVGALPMCFYPLSNLIHAGCRDILVLTTVRDLRPFQELLGYGEQYGVRISYQPQESPRGTASALAEAKDFIGENEVVVALGDSIIWGPGFSGILGKHLQPGPGAKLLAFESLDPRHEEVAKFAEDGSPNDFVEKPESPPSNLVVAGFYVYDNRAVHFASEAPLSERGEYELNSVHRSFLKEDAVELFHLPAPFRYFDAGRFESFIEVNSFVRKLDANLGADFGSPHLAACECGIVSVNDYHRIRLNFGHGSRYGDSLTSRPRVHESAIAVQSVKESVLARPTKAISQKKSVANK